MSPRGVDYKRLPYFISAGLAVLFFLLQGLGWIDFHEMDAVDLQFRLRGKASAHPQIILVEIDDPSIALIGQWPWSRDVHALLLDVLRSFQPQYVFFDILFTEKGRNEEDDRLLGEAVRLSGNIILPFFYYSLNPFKAFFPIDVLAEGALGAGYVNVDTDHDGVVRRIKPKIVTERGTFYHPVVKVQMNALEGGDEKKKFMESLPLDDRGYLWINYPGDIHVFQRIPFWKLIDAAGEEGDEELRRMIQNSFVIVGQTATGTTDLRATPFGPNQPGLIIQASVAHTLLTGNFIRPAPWYLNLVCILFGGLLTTFLTKKMSPPVALFSSLGVAVLYGVTAVFCFHRTGVMFLLFVPMFVIGFSYLLTLLLRYLEVHFKGELIMRELQMAAQIQESFLPTARPVSKEMDVSFSIQFVKEVGGDLYDWVELDNGMVGVCIGDVSGKGVPAALYMARVMNEIRGKARLFTDPSEMIKAVSRQLSQSGMATMFVTIFYAIIDFQSRKIYYCSAGHEPIIYYDRSEDRSFLIQEPQGMPAGLFEDAEYEPGVQFFEKGDCFLGYTDGVKELRNPARKEMGAERLTEFFVLKAAGGMAAEEINRGLFEDMAAYAKGNPAHDDRTLLCVRFL